MIVLTILGIRGTLDRIKPQPYNHRKKSLSGCGAGKEMWHMQPYSQPLR
jgi:hypothetical protein